MGYNKSEIWYIDCAVCGEPVRMTPCQERRGKKYCSMKCKRIGRRNKHIFVNEVECKQCSSCKEVYPLNQFHTNPSNWDNVSDRCKFCTSEYFVDWRQTEQGQTLAKAHHHKRRERFEAGGELTKETVREVFQENIREFGKLTCVYCEEGCENDWHLEHMIPLSREGTNNKNNLAIACPTCNRRKHTKTADEFLKAVRQ